MSFNAFATYEIEGNYKGSGEGKLSMSVIVLDNEKGIVAVNATTTSGACTGTIAGIGSYSDNQLKFSNYVKDEGAESCEVTVKFNGKKAAISESNCGYYHGAACAFDGNLKP